MKIPEEYGAFDCNHNVVMQYLGDIDGNKCALCRVAAGWAVRACSEPRCRTGDAERRTCSAKVSISINASSNRAIRLTAECPRDGKDAVILFGTDDGGYFILNGEKLWCVLLDASLSPAQG